MKRISFYELFMFLIIGAWVSLLIWAVAVIPFTSKSDETVTNSETKPEIIYKTIYVDEKMKECEQSDGIYSVFFNDFRNKYIIRCETPAKEIFRIYK